MNSIKYLAEDTEHSLASKEKMAYEELKPKYRSSLVLNIIVFCFVFFFFFGGGGGGVREADHHWFQISLF